MKPTVLLTGGAGYIGSHTAVELIASGYDVVLLDNLCNSSVEVVKHIEHLAGSKVTFIEADVRDFARLKTVFIERNISAVIHFAGLKSVSESSTQPLQYFDNNVAGTLNLLRAMATAKVTKFVFSSSAAVYGNPSSVPVPESAKLAVTNPYGRSKLIAEEILADLQQSSAAWHIGILRYFNPVGAHRSGLIGERPRGIPSNLMPYIAQVAAGVLPRLTIFGNDYSTRDGTGVRDYIHVTDLAKGHVAALNRLNSAASGFTVNLGTGNGYSVLEMVRAFEKASGRNIPYQIAPRRQGEIAECFADPRHAEHLLGWRAEQTLEDMCADHWRWQVKSGNNISTRHI